MFSAISSLPLSARLEQLENQGNNPIVTALYQQLAKQHFHGFLFAETVQQLCERYALSPIQLALNALPLAACYAVVPVSQFLVGAVAIGVSGHFYFGANQESAGVAISQTVHAEQSAIMHAWECGEQAISDVVVNHTPCGHCRQFMNELNSAKTLKIHLPHSQNNRLHSYLPDDFGPHDLNVSHLLFDTAQQDLFATKADLTDPLIQAAVEKARFAYAPYSQTFATVALQAGEQIFTGRYAENAAFNPSFLPLQSALNHYRLAGSPAPIERIVLAEKTGTASTIQATHSLVASLYPELNVTVIKLD